MNFLDLIILVPLLWCGFKGARNGLVMELMSFLALVAGFYMSFKFSYLVGEWFSINGRYAQTICFVIMFIGVSVGV
ncbi:MAG: CvpA family protein, partial [Bacteroidales bacterium]|nr:CvpA family protein [Bacteroidales bacterium]